MKCGEIKELLSLYIDRMLDESLAKKVEEHLSACVACRKEYDEMKEMLDLLGQAGTVPVPDAFSFRLKKALKEEKQNMIDSGIISKSSMRKNRWRIITSVAAVFTVGVLSFGLYKDIFGILPDRLNGEAPADTAQKEEIYDAKSFDSEDQAGIAADSAENLNSTSDGTVVMKEKASDSTQQAAAFGAAGSPEPDAGDESAAADAATEAEAANGAAGFDGYYPQNSRLAPNPEECSRSSTVSGIERNTAAVQYYNNLIEDKLGDFDYQVLEYSYVQTGEWQFRIFIFRGKDGNTYNEEILIIGKEGEIKVICSNEFVGL